MFHTLGRGRHEGVSFRAKDVAAIKEGELARGRVRIHFKSLLRLAHAERDMEKAVVAGSVPPGARQLWDSLRKHGVEVEELFDRGTAARSRRFRTFSCNCGC